MTLSFVYLNKYMRVCVWGWDGQRISSPCLSVQIPPSISSHAHPHSFSICTHIAERAECTQDTDFNFKAPAGLEMRRYHNKFELAYSVEFCRRSSWLDGRGSSKCKIPCRGFSVMSEHKLTITNTNGFLCSLKPVKQQVCVWEHSFIDYFSP